MGGNATDGASAGEREEARVGHLRLGQSAEKARLVSAEAVAAFAQLSGDFNPLHLDAKYAATTSFGRPIAHGPLALALAAGILGTELPGPGSVAISNEIRYLRPIFVGETITTRVEVVELLPQRRRVRLALSWANESGELVAEGEAVVRPPQG